MRCSARRHRRLLRHILHLSAGTCGLGVVANECTQTKECKHCGGIMVSNMRVCQHCRSLNTSTWPFRGVKGKKRQHDDMVWQAFIWHDRKNEYIGTFLFPEEAAAAYDKRARVRRQTPPATTMLLLPSTHRRSSRAWPLSPSLQCTTRAFAAVSSELAAAT